MPPVTSFVAAHQAAICLCLHRATIQSVESYPPNAPKTIFWRPGLVARSPGQFPPTAKARSAPKPMWHPEIMPIKNVLKTGAAAFFSPMSTAFWYISGGGFTAGALAAAGAAATAPALAAPGRATVDIRRALASYR